MLYIDAFKDEGIKSFFTTAAGAGHSPYMNKAVRAELDMNNIPWIRSRQIHKDNIMLIESNPGKDIAFDGYDGFITDIPDICLITAHADCIPVQLYDPQQKVIAAIHAGWRGTALGIAAKAVRIMREQYRCRNINAYIGPGISSCCFETDSDVPQKMKEAFEWAGEYISEGCREGKFYTDLKGINKRQMLEAGATEVKTSGVCTCCNENYCSYRRNPTANLRMASGICIFD